MKQTRRVELDEFHVRDHGPGPPRHRHAVARRDVGIGRVEVNLSTAARGEDETIGPDRFHFARALLEYVGAEAAIFRRETEFAGRDEIDRHVILHQRDRRRFRELAQERLLDLQPGHILHMQNAPLRVSALASQIRFAMSPDLAIVEMQSALHQFSNAFRAFHDNRPHGGFVTKPRTRFQRVAHVKLEGIFIARHARDSALSPRCIRISALTFGNDGDRAVLRGFQGKAQAGDAAPNHDEVVFLHRSWMLSISLVFPK